ncbi:hypothetical protein BDM02DRAFT_3182613 [Thelephora ganbajun]|uniref:Uncharacterized protein n=1 Tax=Thelephora ganbajun TaxID=370292 RepID=A0ACB6ZVP0_THEGA|nr:hypothetical protein BDM02DRAFT_3182613 [Thelephora ganbajun]
MQDSPPPIKRIKLESPPPGLSHSKDVLSLEKEEEEEEDVDNQCSICLQRLTDRTLIPRCSHEFCFECLVIWADQSRRCPLCAQGIGEYLIHNVRSKYDYTKYFLPPLRSGSPVLAVGGSSSSNQRRLTRRERQWGQRERREQEVQDQLERSIKRRKWVYRHNLYAKHVASNVYTRYRPFPTPAQFATSSDYISRATSFLRRELQVWPNLDIEFLTTFTLSIMKSLDIRSESAVKLLSEFLDMDQPYMEGHPHPNAEHFAHEMYSYLRSPFRDLYVYDKMVQVRTILLVLHFGMMNRKIFQADASNKFVETIRGQHFDHVLLRDIITHSREDRMEVVRTIGDEGLAERLLRGDESAADLGLMTRRGFGDYEIQVVKGKGKAMDLDEVANSPGPPTSGSEVERATIDKEAGDAQVCELPNTEHMVIGDSIRGNRDRRPKALTLRQSVQAHLSLQKTEPHKVSRPAAGPESRISGPGLRHGRPSLFERISGMEGVPHSQLVSVSAVDISASPDHAHPLRPAAVQPERLGVASSNINPTEEGTIDIDNQRPDLISNIIRQDNSATQADRPDRPPRINAEDVLERTRLRLAKMKNVVVAGIPPTAPTPPAIPLDPSTPAGAIPLVPVVATLRNKLLERLESERKRAIGAASGEPEVEPVAGNISEDSLKAELRARNQLRARLVVAKADRHVGNLEP